ncbi:hypothetical protein GF338_12430, partial [candidate division WOR-3 bacterium]|nr:hypothetical protein [candidate division WOR-3 bacterium]
MKGIPGLFLSITAFLWGGVNVTTTGSRGVKIKIDASKDLQGIRSHSRIDISELYPWVRLDGDLGSASVSGRRFYIGVPPEGEVNVEYSTGKSRSFKGVRLIEPSMPGIPETPGYTGPGMVWSSRDVVSYEISRWRDYRVLVIQTNQILYDTASGTLTTYDEVDIDVSFTPPEDIMGGTLANLTLNKIYASTLINYDQCRGWVLEKAQDVVPNPFQETSNWIRVSVPTDGVYTIRYKDIKKMGIDPKGIDPETIRLLYTDITDFQDLLPDTLAELPVYVHGEADGSFDRYDYVVFFGRGANRWNLNERSFQVNPYFEDNAYWMTWGGSDGVRVQTRFAHPVSGEERISAQTILHFEEDHECPGRSGFLWLWEEITKTEAYDRKSDTFILNTPGIERIDTFTFKAYTTTDTSGFRLLVKGDTLYYRAAMNRGPDPLPYTVISPEMMIGEQLPLEIEVFGPKEQNIFPDWVRIVAERNLSFKHGQFWGRLKPEYVYSFEDLKSSPYIFDLTDIRRPVVLTDYLIEDGSLRMSTRTDGAGYFWMADDKNLMTPELTVETPGELWDEDWSVDYLVLSTTENFEAAEEYARYREEKLVIPGIDRPRARAVDLADVVRDFGYGMSSPQAIRHFLEYVYNKGEGRPFYVLILGDGTYDYKNNLGFTGRPEYFPIYTEGYLLDPNVTSKTGAAKEFWFVDFDDNAINDPELSVARIPARNSREAFMLLDKIRSYEDASYETWRSRIILLADDYYLGRADSIDPISNHISACEDLASNLLYPEFDPVKVYLSDYQLIGGKKPDAHKALM